MSSNYDVKMLDILKRWQEAHGNAVINFKAASAWAKENNLYDREPISAEKQCENDMRIAVRRAHYTDPQNRKVRIYGAAKLKYEGEQLPLIYVDMRTANPDVAKDVFDLKHNGMKNDVRRHSIEKQSYDDNNPYRATLEPYDYNFNDVAEDARLSGTYEEPEEDEEN